MQLYELKDRLFHAWNTFKNKDPTGYIGIGPGFSGYRPDHINGLVHAVQLVIQPDRTDLRRIDGILAAAAVANRDLTRKLLVEIHAIQIVHAYHERSM